MVVRMIMDAFIGISKYHLLHQIVNIVRQIQVKERLFTDKFSLNVDLFFKALPTSASTEAWQSTSVPFSLSAEFGTATYTNNHNSNNSPMTIPSSPHTRRNNCKCNVVPTN